MFCRLVFVCGCHIHLVTRPLPFHWNDRKRQRKLELACRGDTTPQKGESNKALWRTVTSRADLLPLVNAVLLGALRLGCVDGSLLPLPCISTNLTILAECCQRPAGRVCYSIQRLPVSRRYRSSYGVRRCRAGDWMSVN
jgi:hypothetical protein